MRWYYFAALAGIVSAGTILAQVVAARRNAAQIRKLQKMGIGDNKWHTMKHITEPLYLRQDIKSETNDKPLATLTRIFELEGNEYKEKYSRLDRILDIDYDDDEKLAEAFKKYILKFNPEAKKRYF